MVFVQEYEFGIMRHDLAFQMQGIEVGALVLITPFNMSKR